MHGIIDGVVRDLRAPRKQASVTALISLPLLSWTGYHVSFGISCRDHASVPVGFNVGVTKRDKPVSPLLTSFPLPQLSHTIFKQFSRKRDKRISPVLTLVRPMSSEKQAINASLSWREDTAHRSASSQCAYRTGTCVGGGLENRRHVI